MCFSSSKSSLNNGIPTFPSELPLITDSACVPLPAHQPMCWDQAPDSKPARATPSPGKFLNINRFFVWYHLANPEHVRISVEISGFSAVRWWMRAFAYWVCDGNPSPKIRTSAYSGRTALGRKFGKNHIKLPTLEKKLPQMNSTKVRTLWSWSWWGIGDRQRTSSYNFQWPDWVSVFWRLAQSST